MLSSRFLRRSFNYDPLTHSMLGSIICFTSLKTQKISYGIVLPEKKQIVLIDPCQDNIPDYAMFMDEHELQIRACVITGEQEIFTEFYDDLKDIKAAFSEDYSMYSSLRQFYCIFCYFYIPLILILSILHLIIPLNLHILTIFIELHWKDSLILTN